MDREPVPNRGFRGTNQIRSRGSANSSRRQTGPDRPVEEACSRNPLGQRSNPKGSPGPEVGPRGRRHRFDWPGGPRSRPGREGKSRHSGLVAAADPCLDRHRQALRALRQRRPSNLPPHHPGDPEPAGYRCGLRSGLEGADDAVGGDPPDLQCFCGDHRWYSRRGVTDPQVWCPDRLAIPGTTGSNPDHRFLRQGRAGCESTRSSARAGWKYRSDRHRLRPGA